MNAALITPAFFARADDDGMTPSTALFTVSPEPPASRAGASLENLAVHSSHGGHAPAWRKAARSPPRFESL